MAEGMVGLWEPEIAPHDEVLASAVLYLDRISTFAPLVGRAWLAEAPETRRMLDQLGDAYEPLRIGDVWHIDDDGMIRSLRTRLPAWIDGAQRLMTRAPDPALGAWLSRIRNLPTPRTPAQEETATTVRRRVEAAKRVDQAKALCEQLRREAAEQRTLEDRLPATTRDARQRHALHRRDRYGDLLVRHEAILERLRAAKTHHRRRDQGTQGEEYAGIVSELHAQQVRLPAVEVPPELAELRDCQAHREAGLRALAGAREQLAVLRREAVDVRRLDGRRHPGGIEMSESDALLRDAAEAGVGGISALSVGKLHPVFAFLVEEAAFGLTQLEHRKYQNVVYGPTFAVREVVLALAAQYCREHPGWVRIGSVDSGNADDGVESPQVPNHTIDLPTPASGSLASIVKFRFDHAADLAAIRQAVCSLTEHARLVSAGMDADLDVSLPIAKVAAGLQAEPEFGLAWTTVSIAPSETGPAILTGVDRDLRITFSKSSAQQEAMS